MTHFKQGPEANGGARNKTCFISATYIDFLVATFAGKLHDVQKLLWTFGFLLLLATFNLRGGGGGDSQTHLNFVSSVCVWAQWAG